MKSALVHGQLVIVEGQAGSGVPLIVTTIECDICGSYSIVVAAHHAKSLLKILRDCIAELPDEATADEGQPLPTRRPPNPEDN
jgi:hypothetical protein